MFCALNGATFTPRRCSQRQIPAVSTLLPASDVVPATSRPPLTARAAAPRRAAVRDLRSAPGAAPAECVAGSRARRPRPRRPRDRRAGEPDGPRMCRRPARAVAEERPGLGASEVDVAPTEAYPERTRPSPPRTGPRSGSGGRRGRAARPGSASARRPLAAGATAMVSSAVSRDGSRLSRSSSRADGGAEPRVPRRPVADHRVERVDRPVAEQPRHAARPRPRTAARRRRRRCSRRPTRRWPGPAPGRRALAGRARTGG